MAVEVPPWLWGGAPGKFFTKANLRVRRPVAQSQRWLVQTEESYSRVRPGLVVAEHIAGPAQRKARFDILTRVAQDAAAGVNLKDKEALGQIDSAGQRAEKSSDLARLFYYWQLLATVAEPHEFATVVADIHASLAGMPAEGDPGLRLFRNAGVHLIRRSDVLLHRTKIAGVLLRVAYDETLSGGDIRHVQALSAAGERVFSSSENLLQGIFLFDTYLGPLLGAMTPTFWAFSAHRTFGPLIFSLGHTINGTRSGPGEFLHLLPSQGALRATWSITDLPPIACSEAVAWWAARLDALFGVVSDLAVFADGSGLYNPRKHLQALLTVEQLFRRVGSLLTSPRDAHVQRVLLFTVLDTVERLTGRDIDRLCYLPFAEKKLKELEASVPPAAGAILLPLAQRAVVALKELQDGFFMPGQLASGQVAGLSKDVAAARYVKVLRNATHGHGAKSVNLVDQTNALLAHHDGDIPHDLPLLGYLYLLDWIARPDDYRRFFYKSN
ncbi:hypothetical protein ABZ793_12405 [Micromonospora sp. NPDC047465]|uniref:hypothetical protein n=1 Tax=Micromonospora sp. NPDC047465 TaxID=3154813 RepID=UPI0033C8CF7F